MAVCGMRLKVMGMLAEFVDYHRPLFGPLMQRGYSNTEPRKPVRRSLRKPLCGQSWLGGFHLMSGARSRQGKDAELDGERRGCSPPAR